MNELKSVLVDQKREMDERFRRERIIKREMEEKLTSEIKSEVAKVVMGVRRAGKSIMCYHLLNDKEFLYVNFDDERLDGIQAKDLNELIKIYVSIHGKDFYLALLDEPQRVKGWELFVNRLLRAGKSVFVTGSSSELLSKELATHLTGRHLDYLLFPFSFREFLKFKDVEINEELMLSTKGKGILLKHLSEFIKKGGMPQALKIHNWQGFLRGLYEDIIMKDVVLRYRIRYVQTFKTISRFLMKSHSKYVSFNSVRKAFGVKTIHTVRDYADYLESAFLLFFVKKYAPSLKEVENVPKKVYCIDTGILTSLFSSPEIGRLMENVVGVELLRRKAYLGGNPEVYYFKDYQGREVDFVLKEDSRISQLIQVTYAAGPDEIEKRELRSLLKASKELRCKNLLVITWDYNGEEVRSNRKVKFVPLWKWLLR